MEKPALVQHWEQRLEDCLKGMEVAQAALARLAISNSGEEQLLLWEDETIKEKESDNG